MTEDREAYLQAPWTMRSAATGSSSLRERYSTALFTLLAIVGTVLLVACANVANLQLARTAGRRYEFGVRAALGASRARIARQQLVECLLMSAIGTVLGLVFAQWVGRLIVAQLSTWAATAFLDLTPDWRVLGAITVVMILTTVIFGTAPAFRASRADPIEALNRQRRGAVGGASMGLTDGIVVVQVGLSLLLVVGGSLFLRSFLMLVTRDLGFDRGRVLVAVIDGRRSGVAPGGRLALYERLRDAAAALPGVETAALSMATPLGSAGVRFTPSVSIPGNPAATELRILAAPVSPGWFETFGTRLLTGRDFDSRDRAGSGPVVIVNEAFAQRYLNGAPPIGQTILVGQAPADLRPAEIVGLVRDAAFTSVRDPIAPTLYRSFAQTVDEALLTRLPSISLSARAAGERPAASLTNALAASIKEIDPGVSVSFQTVTETLRPYHIRDRLLAMVSGYFGALALLLAAVGLYGVTAHSVHRRRTEIGIRMAMGATGARIARLVMGRIALLVVLGTLVGVLGSVWMTRLVESLLVNTPGRDPLTFGLATAFLTLASAIAAGLPTRRAARIDPATVLREG